MMKKNTLIAFLGLSLLMMSCGKKEEIVTIKTEFGDIVVLLYDETPLHKENFLKLAKDGTYDSTTFHRIIDGFMIQGGDTNTKNDDPNDDGQGDLGYRIPAEFNDSLKHIKGALAAARKGDRMNPQKESSASQFYIVEEDNGTHFLDGSYTVFGQTISGLDVIDKIAGQEKGFRDRPVKNIYITMEVKKLSQKKISKEYGYIYADKKD